MDGAAPNLADGLGLIGALLAPRLDPDGVPTLRGWVLRMQGEAGEPPEVAVEVPGLGIQVVAAELPAPEEPGVPPGACGFAWRWKAHGTAPSAVLRAWHLGAGAELSGSPLTLPTPSGRAPEAPRPGDGPLLHWPQGIAGRIAAGPSVEIADGLWVSASAPAALLRHELLAEPDPAGGPPRRGVKLLADRPAAVLEAFLRLDGAPAGLPRAAELRAWLPQATEAVTQLPVEVSLAGRGAEGFATLRRLRRSRLFRRPTAIALDLALTAEDLAALPGEAWIRVTLREAGGLCLMPPAPRGVEPEGAEPGLEDARLAESFADLARATRLQSGAAGPAALPRPALPAGLPHPWTQVIVPVHDGGLLVRDCLRSVRAGTAGPCQVVVVDDGSREHTAALLRAEAAADPRLALHRRDVNRGYTKSINEAVAMTSAEWVVILNSDTLVPPGWLERLHAAAAAHPGTGMVGPLSNAATWQSIPAAKRPDGSWASNEAIGPGDLGRVQALVDAASERAYPAFPLLNGFCTLIARAVFDAVGSFDEDAFPTGYGEETDLCLRARAAGFRLTVADDCFVYHHKSRSFGAGTRAGLTRAGGLELRNKHPGLNIAALEASMQDSPPMARLRARIAAALGGGA